MILSSGTRNGWLMTLFAVQGYDAAKLVIDALTQALPLAKRSKNSF
jgi:hypothetical protein